MRWRTAHNKRKQAERSYERNGRWQALWPNLRENFSRWANSLSADIDNLPMPGSPHA